MSDKHHPVTGVLIGRIQVCVSVLICEYLDKIIISFTADPPDHMFAIDQ